MEPLYIVDGSGYIYRAFFGVQPLSTSSGLPTNALFGFTRMLIKLLRDLKAHYIVVAFDTAEPTFRHRMFSEYKANREECPADLVPQLPYFRKIVQAFGIQALELPGYEADDIIATLTNCFASPNQRVVIVSGDKDLTQLVTEDVEVYDAMRDIHYDVNGVVEKFGVRPNQIIDYLSLVGDSSDNVPGIRGVGPKSAQLLIQHFGSVEKLLEQPENIEKIRGLRGAAAIRGKVESDPAALRLSYDLIRLDSNVAPYNGMSDIQDFRWHGASSSLIQPLLEELEFANLAKSVPYNNGSESLSSNATRLDLDSKAYAAGESRRYHTVTTKDFDRFLDQLSGAKQFAFDTETTSLDVWSCNLVGLSFSWQEGVAYYLSVGSTLEPESNLDFRLIKERLSPIFAAPEVKKFGLNLKFDLNVLAAHGIPVRGVSFDSMLASYLLSPDRRQHGLSALTRVHLKETMQSFEELVGDAAHIGEVPVAAVTQYACHDADASYRLQPIMNGLLGPRTECSLRRVFEDLEMPLLPVLSQMEQVGIAIDLDFLSGLEQEFRRELAELEQRIHQLAGGPFNLNSPKQLSEVLFERLAISTAGIKKRESHYSTDESVLTKLSSKYPIAKELLQYRELFKLNSTYIVALQRLVNPKTVRIHTSFNQAVASSGRLSSSDPNLQNIPIKGERGRKIRQAFVARTGDVLISADYSQIELRVLAHMSGDENLVQAFINDDDIHSRTAREIFGEFAVAGDSSGHFRRLAKTINFGIVYGMGAFRLADQLGISRAQAQQYIDQYFARYPKVKRFFSEITQRCESEGYVETIYGRRRYLRDIDTSGRDAGYARRSLENFPLQGSAADIIKAAMVRLASELQSFSDSARLVLQVHDELLVECKEELAKDVSQTMVHVMEGAVSLQVPLKVETKIAKQWS